MQLQSCVCFSYKALQIFYNVNDSDFPSLLSIAVVTTEQYFRAANAS